MKTSSLRKKHTQTRGMLTQVESSMLICLPFFLIILICMAVSSARKQMRERKEAREKAAKQESVWAPKLPAPSKMP